MIISTFLCPSIRAQKENQIIVLKGKAGVEAVFEVRDSFGRWSAYRDTESAQNWNIDGPTFYLQTLDGKYAIIAEQNSIKVLKDSTEVVIEMDISSSPLRVRQTYSFGKDGRTLRINGVQN